MNKFWNWLLKPDWVLDDEGDVTLRLWGRFGITHYKWQDGAIFQNSKSFRPVAKRGIIGSVKGFSKIEETP